MKPSHSKKGIELSVNFLVILIIAFVVFIGGSVLVYRIFDSTVQLKENVDLETQDRIESLIAAGQRVVVPDSHKVDHRGKLIPFALGISNELGETHRFFVVIDPGIYVPPSGEGGNDGGIYPDKLLQIPGVGFDIANNKVVTIPFGFVASGEVLPGTYVFNVQVKYRPDEYSDWADYDTIQKVYVEIK